MGGCGMRKLHIFSLFLLSQRRLFQFDSVSIAEEPVKETVGNGRLSNDIMPFANRQRRGEDCGMLSIAVFTDLEQGWPCWLIERLQTTIVNNQKPLCAELVGDKYHGLQGQSNRQRFHRTVMVKCQV